MKPSILAAAAALVAASALPAMAATIFSDRASFEAAVEALPRPLVLETFDEDIPTADTITFASGTTATKTTPGVPPTLNRVRFGQYTGFVQRDDVRNILFMFGVPTLAFGADFSGLTSLMVTGAFDGETETVSIFDTIGAAGFFGLTSTTPFAQVTFTTNTGVFLFGSPVPFGGETFNVDNLVTAPIPLPAGGFLILGALGGLGALRLRRAARAQSA